MTSKAKSIPAAEAALKAHRQIMSPWIDNDKPVACLGETPREAVLDLLASLRHLADREAFDFSDVVAESQIMYQEELEGTDGEDDDDDSIGDDDNQIA